MIIVRVAWDKEPERLVGPFGQVNEALKWISEWKEAMYLNAPNVSARLVTSVLIDPVEGMSWATSLAHLQLPQTENGDHPPISPLKDSV
jgi:hypothetical protein